jgi:hypothetical protein
VRPLCINFLRFIVISLFNIKKNIKALLIASKTTDLEANAEKTKSMVMSQDQNAGKNSNLKDW